jgi:hypothetical protein
MAFQLETFFAISLVQDWLPKSTVSPPQREHVQGHTPAQTWTHLLLRICNTPSAAHKKISMRNFCTE